MTKQNILAIAPTVYEAEYGSERFNFLFGHCKEIGPHLCPSAHECELPWLPVHRQNENPPASPSEPAGS